MKAAAAWAIGQIGRHTPEHARVVGTANLLPALLQLYLDTNSSEDLQVKVGMLGSPDRRFVIHVQLASCNN